MVIVTLLAIVIASVLIYKLSVLLINGRRRKGEPPLITGTIPYLGVIYDYGAHPANYLRSLKEKYGDIFTIVLAGKRITYITNPLDYQKVYANPKQLSFHEVGSDVAVTAFGISREICENDEIQSEISRHFVRYLQSPDAISELTSRMQEKLEYHLAKDIEKIKTWRTEGLFDLICRMISSASIDALFGDNFFKDKVLEDVKVFDETLHLNIAGIPKFMLKKSMKAREDIASLFLKEYENPSSFIAARNDLLKSSATHEDFIYGQATILWASQVNTFPATFWTIAHLLKQPKHIISEILDEIDECLGELGPVPGGVHLQPVTRQAMEKMVKLNSCVDEALRLCAYNISARKVKENMTFAAESGKYKLRKGDDIHIVTFTTHRDEEIYPNASQFQYDRFLQQQKRQVTKSGKLVPPNMLLLPFGNGVSYCPGRFFARNEIKLCAAMFLSFFDFKFVDENEPLPPYNFARFGLSLLPPEKDIQIMYKLKDKFTNASQ